MTEQSKPNNQTPSPDNQADGQAQATPTEKTLQGWQAPLETEEQMHDAIDQAFDYRGDVTIRTTDGRTIEGYLYDRQTDAEGLTIRMMPNDGSRRTTLSQSEIAGLKFTGKDTAEGRSFEAWIKKYAEKKKAGQEASIYHEST